MNTHSIQTYPIHFLQNLWQSFKETYHKIKWQSQRGFGRTDRQLIQQYLSTYAIKKLQIGAGTNLREDWLNTNYFPWRKEVMHLDASAPFPFANDTFDYVFSEHMIEHISYPQGLHMLRECFRALRPGGKIRISTPDIQFLFDLYQQKHTPIQAEYNEWMVNWMRERDMESAPYPAPIFIINNFVRDWGHQFIYDEDSLRFALAQAGFTAVRRCQIQESEDPILRQLEHEQRYPPGFLRLETLTMEGSKPVVGVV